MDRAFEVLLVEDNQADADLTVETLEEAKIICNVNVATDGMEAMAFLRQEGKYKDAPLPDIILLDLNMPKMDGRQVLADIKEDPNLMEIPVIVLTSSEAEADILKTYKLHANAYVKKPVDLGEFGKIISALDEFWFSVVKLPNLSRRKSTAADGDDRND